MKKSVVVQCAGTGWLDRRDGFGVERPSRIGRFHVVARCNFIDGHVVANVKFHQWATRVEWDESKWHQFIQREQEFHR